MKSTESGIIWKGDRDLWRLENEIIAGKLLNGKLSVPLPKFCCEDKSEGIVYDILLGDPIGDRQEYFPLAGKTLRSLHKLSFDNAGPFDISSLLPCAQSWNDFFRDIWNYDFQNLSASDSKLDLESVRAWFNGRKVTEDHSFLHVDYSPKNVLIDANGKIKVIDFEFCCSGNPLYDLAWSLMSFGSNAPGVEDPNLEFLKGYIGNGELSLSNRSEIQTYFMAHMLRALRVDVPNAVDSEMAKSRLEMRVNNGLESGIVLDI